MTVVSCGVPLPGHDVRIVDATGRSMPERIEGRVEFRGPSVTWLPRRGPIMVTLGAPIPPRGSDWRDVVRLRDATRAEISRAAVTEPS